MKESIKIFENAQFGQIRTSVAENGEPLFCLADLCKAIGVSNHRNVAKRIDEDGVRRMDITDSLGRNQQVLFVTEPGMYEVLLRSDSAKAKPFRNWVCGEVLPSIRKSGGYMVARVDETPEQIMARALIVAQETISRQKAAVAAAEKRATLLEATTRQMTVQINGLETKNKELLPGATFAKAVETSEHSILIGELARIIKQNGVEIGQNRLFQWLRENGFLCKKGEWYNQPTQRAMEMGLFEIKKTVITKPSGDSLVTTTTKVTGKGQIYFVNRFLYEKSKQGGNNTQIDNESGKKGGCAMKKYVLSEQTTRLLNCVEKMQSLYEDVYESLLAIYSSDDVDEMIANQFIVEYDALEKRIESFVMQSIKENINITNNEI